MKYLDEYREPTAAHQLVDEIVRLARRRWVVMDVCGGQTHNLLRYGIEQSLEPHVELIHGPGCPVCVTPIEAIDFAQHLALQPKVTVTTFGDMMRVPGTSESLLATRAGGGSIRAIYSPIEAVRFAHENPGRQIVFFAVGFETTVPATALAAIQADRLGLKNFSLLIAHVRVLPAMEQLIASPSNRVQAFLGAGHVCTITGLKDYQAFVERFRVPLAITGFEPLDLLYGIREVVRQLESGRNELSNCYPRSVRFSGNRAAQKAIEAVYEACDAPWRGFGTICRGGWKLNRRYAYLDARHRFATVDLPIIADRRCRSAEVLSGQIKPTQCSEFAKHCDPERPLGAPMVSSEGACAAYYRYQRS